MKIENLLNRAEHEDVDAFFHLGLTYKNGDGVDLNVKTAFEWFAKAANKGHLTSLHYVGNMYESGEIVFEDTPPEFLCEGAVRWIGNAVDTYPDSMYQLGIMYLTGRNLPQNFTKAIGWFIKAATLGDVDAQRQLGELYINRSLYPISDLENISKYETDDRSAVKWFSKAAEQGDVVAQYELGRLYFYGDGTFKNIKRAAELFSEVAKYDWHDQNYIVREALINLGDIYREGFDVPRDVLKAFDCYSEAEKIFCDSDDDGYGNYIKIKLQEHKLACEKLMAADNK